MWGAREDGREGVGSSSSQKSSRQTSTETRGAGEVMLKQAGRVGLPTSQSVREGGSESEWDRLGGR